MEGRVDWVVGYTPRWFTCPKTVTCKGTDEAWHMATTLIWHNVLATRPRRHAVDDIRLCEEVSKYIYSAHCRQKTQQIWSNLIHHCTSNIFHVVEATVVKAGHVHPFRPGVILYGRWCSVSLRWVSHKELYAPFNQCWVRYIKNVFQIQIQIHGHKCISVYHILNTLLKSI